MIWLGWIVLIFGALLAAGIGVAQLGYLIAAEDALHAEADADDDGEDADPDDYGFTG